MYSAKRRIRLFRSPAWAPAPAPAPESFVNPILTLGSATTAVSQSPFVGGGSSYNFVSSVNSYITVPGSADWAVGTGDFTIEWFSYQTTLVQAQRVFTIGDSPSLSARISNGSFAYLANVSTRYSSSGAAVADTWYHWAIVRQSGVTKVYRNGVQRGASRADVNNIINSTTTLVLGNTNTFDISAAFVGYITNFRWVKGLAVYTGNFTVPTSELTATASANPYGGSNTSAIGAGFTKLLLVPTDGGAVPIFTYDTLTLGYSEGGSTFVAKYTDTGRILWGAPIEGASGYKILVDGDENVYVVGTSVGGILISNANGSEFGFLETIGSSIGFIVKYNTYGRVQWATRIGGNATIESGAIDSSGNVYVLGKYSSRPLTIYNADGNPFGTLANHGSRDCCVIKYNGSGVAQWSASIGDYDTESVGGISVDSTGNVFVTGRYTDYIIVYNADTTQFAEIIGDYQGNTFIVKYNNSGVAQWWTQVSLAEPAYNIHDCAVDTDGNIIISCQGPAGVSDPPIVYNADTSIFALSEFESTSINTFVIKYNTSGTVQWILPIGTYQQRLVVSTGTLGSFYVSEPYSNDPLTIYNADDSTFDTLDLIGAGSDGAVIKYNSAGVGQWATRIGGTSASGDPNRAISADSVDNVYVGGEYTSNPITIYNANGSVFGTLIGTDANNGNGYIIKYNSSGTAQWSVRMDGGQTPRPEDISPKGTSVYVMGGYSMGSITLRSVGF